MCTAIHTACFPSYSTSSLILLVHQHSCTPPAGFNGLPATTSCVHTQDSNPHTNLTDSVGSLAFTVLRLLASMALYLSPTLYSSPTFHSPLHPRPFNKGGWVGKLFSSHLPSCLVSINSLLAPKSTHTNLKPQLKNPIKSSPLFRHDKNYFTPLSGVNALLSS